MLKREAAVGTETLVPIYQLALRHVLVTALGTSSTTYERTVFRVLLDASFET